MTAPTSGVNDPVPTPPTGTPTGSIADDLAALGDADGDAALRAEIARLEAAIAAANARAAAARSRRADREAEVRESMRQLLLDAQARLGEMDRQHDECVAGIRAAAVDEVERIRVAARQQEGHQ